MLDFSVEEPRLGKPPSQRTLEERLEYGVFCIDKPEGPTSHETAAFVKKFLGAKKTGHTGTLDHNVSGVLVVLVNEACKISSVLMGGRKEYVCIMRLAKPVPEREIEAAFSNFRGKIYQTPPAESAVKRVLRIREIHELVLLEVSGRDALFRCTTDAGTYIRKLVSDAGEVLGVKTEMLELRRTMAAGYREKNAITLQDLNDYVWLWKKKGDGAKLQSAVMQAEEAVVHLKKAVLTDFGAGKVSLGAKPRISHLALLEEGVRPGDVLALFTGKGELVCLARATKSSEDLWDLREREDAEWAKIERVVHEFK